MERNKLKIDFDHPILPENLVGSLTTGDLDDFYCSAGEVNGLNLFFLLLSSKQHYEEAGDRVLAAHLCFLLAYYLFYCITPPGSQELALHYMTEAIRWDNRQEYHQWLTCIKNGN